METENQGRNILTAGGVSRLMLLSTHYLDHLKDTHSKNLKMYDRQLCFCWYN